MSSSGEHVVLAKIQHNAPDLPVLKLVETAMIDDLAPVCERHKLARQRFSAVMEQGDFSLQLLEAPQVAEDEMRDAVRWKIKDLLNYDVAQAVVDVFEIPGLKEQGRMPQIYAVSAHEDLLKERIQQFEASGMDLCYIDIPELVQRNIACRLPEDEAGVALLYLQAQRGLLTLTHQSVLYLAREMEWGYEALATAVKTDDAPLTLGEADVLDSITLEIQRSLDYYESHFGKPPIKNLVIAPLAKPVAGLLEHIRGSLGLKVRLLNLEEIIDVSESLDMETQAQAFYAIGAALRAE